MSFLVKINSDYYNYQDIRQVSGNDVASTIRLTNGEVIKVDMGLTELVDYLNNEQSPMGEVSYRLLEIMDQNPSLFKPASSPLLTPEDVLETIKIGESNKEFYEKNNPESPIYTDQEPLQAPEKVASSGKTKPIKPGKAW